MGSPRPPLTVPTHQPAPTDKAAIDKLKPGDAITIFTPDPTHYPIAKYAIERGIHVLVTKPAVMTLEHHRELVDLATKHKVLVMVEFHKVSPQDHTLRVLVGDQSFVFG